MAVFTAIGAGIFGAGTFLASVTAAGLQVAAGIAVSLIGRAISGDPEATHQRFGVQGRLQGGDAVPRSILFGWTSTAGSYVWGNTWGTASGVPNAYFTQVFALADYPIRALTGVLVNDASVTLATAAHPSYGFPVLEYRKNGQDHLWVKFYDGTQTAADPFLVGTVASVARPYGTNRVGLGVPYVIVTCMAPERRDGEEKPLFQNGIPRFQFVLEGARLYDPSRDTTVGGDGPHRYNDPSTWGGDGDFYPVVQAYNLMRGIRFNGVWLYGLQSLPATRLPVAAWIAEINKCRASIEGPSGPEPTYRTGGEVQVGAQIKFALEAMLTGCQGRLTEAGGSYRPYVGEPNAPVISFTDDDIISTEEQTFTPFYGLEDTINGIQATYPNPSEGWNDKTAPPLIRTDLEALDGNRRLMASVSLDMVPYGGQVQRLMQSALREAQRARRHTITMGPEFWVLEPGDVVEWTSARNGYVTKLFRVDGIADQPDLNVLLDITEVDPSDYDWNQDEDFRPVVDGPIQLVDTPPLPAIGWQVYEAIVLDDMGRARRPGIEVAYQSGLQGVTQVRVQVRLPDATNPFIDVVIPYGSPWRTQIGGNFPPNTRYEVRGVYVLTQATVTAEWSAWLEVTTPDVKFLPGEDFDPFDVVPDFDTIGPGLSGWIEWVGQSPRELIEAIQDGATHAADQELANSETFKSVRQEIAVSVDSLSASFQQTITVTLVPLQNSVAALADYLTELTAGDGSDVSTARFRMTTLSGPTGYSRIGAETRVDVSDPLAWRGAAWYLDTPNDPMLPTRFLVNADQFIVVNGTDADNPFIFESGALRVRNAIIADLTADNIQANSLTGDRLVAGTITSDKIDVEELVASSAFLNNLVVTNANIATATIGTLQLANGAVTAVVQNIVTTPFTINPNGVVALSTINVPANPLPGTVTAYVEISGIPNAYTIPVQLLEVNTGRIVATSNLTAPGGGGTHTEVHNLSFEGFARRATLPTTYRLQTFTSYSGSATVNYINFSSTTAQR